MAVRTIAGKRGASGRPELVVPGGHATGIKDLAVGPGGRWLVTAGADNTAKLWDVESGCELRTFADPMVIATGRR